MAARFIALVNSRDYDLDYVPCWTWECQRIKEQRRMVATLIVTKIITIELRTGYV